MRDALIRRRPVRWLVLTALLLAMALLFVVVLHRSWTANAADTATVESQRHGVAYLRPLVRLVGALCDAQSAAVAGRYVDTASLGSTMDSVDHADRTHRDALATGQRWIQMRGRIDALRARPGSGQAAYQAFGDTLGLVVDLTRRVGDASNLVVDQELDAYHLADTVLRLPQLMLATGRAVDHATLARGRTQPGAEAVRVAVARQAVAQSMADIGAGLRRSIDATHRSVLGPNLLGPLDTLQWAVDGFVPLVAVEPPAEPVDEGSVAPAGARVHVAAQALGEAVLSELDTLLADRQAELAGQRRVIRGAGVGEIVAALLLLWLVRAHAAMRRRPNPAGDPDGLDDAESDDADSALQTPLSPEYSRELAAAELVDARELIDSEELVHVGRAVRPRRRENADDDAV